MKPSKRIKKLRATIIKEIPFTPNDKATLLKLESLSLNDLLLHYLNWQSRIVPARKRVWRTLSSVTSDQRWRLLKDKIKSLNIKVSTGDDLRPHLSLLAHERGYAPFSITDRGERDIWADKDQLLNKTGLYHFHLGQSIKPNAKTPSGLADRTDDVLFAFVDRSNFVALAIANHDVFKITKSINTDINAERKRLFEIYEKFMSRNLSAGSIYMPNKLILSSGHTCDIRKLADIYAKLINHIEPLFEIDDWREQIFQNKGSNIVSRDHILWCIKDMDLCLYNHRTFCNYKLMNGPI